MVFVTLAGIYAVSRVPLDAIPEFSDVQVIVYTEYPGQVPTGCRGQQHAVDRRGAAWGDQLPGAILGELPIFHRLVGRAEATCRQHESVDRDQHQRGVPVLHRCGGMAWNLPQSQPRGSVLRCDRRRRGLVVLGLALEIKAKGRTSQAAKKLIGLQAKKRPVYCGMARKSISQSRRCLATAPLLSVPARRFRSMDESLPVRAPSMSR